jgi:Tol biopolymer transport system component
MSIKLKVLLSCLPLVFILSCGGGGGGGDDGVVGGGGSVGGGNNSNTLNPGMPGKFFIKHYRGAYTMDADTGEYRLIPNTSNWSSQSDRFPQAGVAIFGAAPIPYNNTDFLVVSIAMESSIARQDYNGNYVSRSLNFNGQIGGALMSQDGQYIVVFRARETADFWLEIYNWNSGALISDKHLDKREVFFLRDNRLFFSDGRTLYFTKPLSTEIDNTLTLPDPGGDIQVGLIGGKAVSPDESQMAFTIRGGAPNQTTGPLDSRLYMVNMDGTHLRLVATTPGDTGVNSGDTSGPRILGPCWSPDGRWLYVQEGYLDTAFNGDGGFTGGTDFYGDMYVLPTEDMGKVFYLSTDDSKRSPEVRRFRRYNTLPGEGGGVTGKAVTTSTMSWMSD